MDTYLTAIRSAYPDFAIREAHLHARQGQFNDVLVVNGAWIFRFPRYPQNAATLVNEVRLLRQIRGQLPLPVPDPLFAHLELSGPQPVFMGYPMLPGQPLPRQRLAEIRDEGALQRLADQLAGFLKALHGLPVGGLLEDLPVQDGLLEWESMYAEIQQHLYAFMRPEARAQVSGFFEAYLGDPSLHQYLPCLRHGDFGPTNILYDPEKTSISAVIDFESLAPGDPAVDLASASVYGQPFLERFHRVYPLSDALLARARFYKGTYALQDALHGFKNNDHAAFESGMAAYI
jgi:aminoglycoside 2''-phosphotransferase